VFWPVALLANSHLWMSCGKIIIAHFGGLTGVDCPLGGREQWSVAQPPILGSLRSARWTDSPCWNSSLAAGWDPFFWSLFFEPANFLEPFPCWNVSTRAAFDHQTLHEVARHEPGIQLKLTIAFEENAHELSTPHESMSSGTAVQMLRPSGTPKGNQSKS
jgi:hypothetical protein